MTLPVRSSGSPLDLRCPLASRSASLSGRLAFGTEYALSYGTTRLETDSQLSPSNPSSSAYVELELRQPLLRGFGRDAVQSEAAMSRRGDAFFDAETLHDGVEAGRGFFLSRSIATGLSGVRR